MHRFLRRSGFVALITSSLFATGSLAGTAPAASAATTASEQSTAVASLGGGTDALNDATSTSSSVSADGRYVVFATKATNAATGVTRDVGNTGYDVYLRDTVSKTTTLVSAKFGSTTVGANANSDGAVISADGKFVAFVSSAKNLVKDQVASANPQVFVRDLKAQSTAFVSAAVGSATTAGDGRAGDPSVSADGSKIAFDSASSNLITGFVVGSAGKGNAFVRDRVAGTTTLASPSTAGPNTGGNDDTSTGPGSISANGKVVAFTSWATDQVKNFVENDTATSADVYRRDLVTATTTLLSGKGGSTVASGNSGSALPAVSIDGRLIAFESTATDLLTGFVDGNTTGYDVFLRDADSGVTTLVSHKTGSAVTGGNQESLWPSISGDGRSVAFTSMATDFGAGTPSAFNDVYVRDTNLDSIVRANVSTAGTLANGASYQPALALDGHSLVYASGATNLVTPASSSAPQVFKTQLRVPGYWLDASDGGIFAFSAGATAPFFGSTGALTLNKPMVGMAPYPDGNGYWLVASDGGIFSFPATGHDNLFFGSTGAIKLNQPIVGMASSPTGKGYWLVASDGGIFSYGDAVFFGSTGAIHLNKPIVGMASSPTGKGYWLVASDGGIFNYGDAAFYGSTGAITLNKPIVGMAASPTGMGYWLVASDGGIFAFGDGAFYGSTGALTLNKPIVGMAAR